MLRIGVLSVIYLIIVRELTSSRITNTDDIIRFPSEQDCVTTNRIIANVKDCAENNQTYCTKTDNYPTRIVQQLLDRQPHKYDDVFGSDMMTEIETRFDPNQDEVELCETYEDVIFPIIGTNSMGVDRFIINTPEKKQGVRISMCGNAGIECNILNKIVANDYVTTCKQQFVYRELVALGDNNQIIKDKFEFPACCSCALYKIKN
ncbi:protein spaetzle-like [Contarinia nasturtii]|uniref:protein spaetzle-like n=1 Tax=Contarinia nasturtii TaxID=265458 RepID=UPI0012D45040|nr:protein spaetzle-like [Contarinia nasturtii]XP_031629389.1 protein spaetzle-like [Contarinia nasturtii]XP_031629390.1 protein spaetzle-like [Contarinia nasturtii]